MPSTQLNTGRETALVRVVNKTRGGEIRIDGANTSRAASRRLDAGPHLAFARSLPDMSLSKKEDEAGLNSYYNNKATILQEARVFNESPISPRKCRALLTRIVYLLYIGETFGTQEATTIFFGTTKLFQHKDVSICSSGK